MITLLQLMGYIPLVRFPSSTNFCRNLTASSKDFTSRYQARGLRGDYVERYPSYEFPGL